MSLESQNVVNMRLQPVIKMLLFLNYIYNTLYIFYQNLVASNQDEDYKAVPGQIFVLARSYSLLYRYQPTLSSVVWSEVEDRRNLLYLINTKNRRNEINF